MKEIIRWHLSIPVTDNPHNLGEIKKDDQGEHVLYLDHFNEVEQLQARIKELIAALQLSKDMFIANDLILPHTFDVIDDALNSAASDKAINEIKAQGIDEAIQYARAFLFMPDEDINDYIALNCTLSNIKQYANKLRDRTNGK